jgi:hypothetical protein
VLAVHRRERDKQRDDTKVVSAQQLSHQQQLSHHLSVQYA